MEDVGDVHHKAEYRAVLVGIDFLIASQKLSWEKLVGNYKLF